MIDDVDDGGESDISFWFQAVIRLIRRPFQMGKTARQNCAARCALRTDLADLLWLPRSTWLISLVTTTNLPISSSSAELLLLSGPPIQPFCKLTPLTRTTSSMTCADLLLVICAFLLPPIPVAFRTGCSCELVVSCILTAAGFVPGLIYSLYVIWHYTGGRHGTHRSVGPENGQYGSLA